MNIEARLTELIGEPGRKLHTARSRNDQVATDLRMWVRDAIDRSDRLLKELQAALLARAEEHADAAMPGFTHLQAAQPVTLGHHLLAYVEMFGRDRGRLADARARLNECPLGAAALAGTSFPIDRLATAAALGFDRPAANSIDAVADRDFALEFLAAAAIAGVHLSRLAEELVLWSTPQFAFVRMAEEFSSGSSIMPQKRNPDAAELVRGKAGRLIGSLSALLVVLKGLPLAYSKDLQEDKEPVFDAADSLALCLAAMAAMIKGMIDRSRAPGRRGRRRPHHRDRSRRLAGPGSRPAVPRSPSGGGAGGAPRRGARRRSRRARSRGAAGDRAAHQRGRVYEVLSVARSVASRTSFGGTAPARVREAIAAARERYL